MQPNTEIERTEDAIVVTLTGRHGSIRGWPDAREDLGLNPSGTPPEGIKLVTEKPSLSGSDSVESAVLRFESADAVDEARDRLYSKATERFEWGDARGGKKVQNIAGAFPTGTELKDGVEA